MEYTKESNVGVKLSEDYWFAYNTVPFVFRWLKPPDLLKCCQVCKLWQQIAMEPLFWRTVKLDSCRLNFDKMSNALNTLGSTHLKLQECIFVLNDSDLFNALKKMPALRKLELSECSSKLIEKLPEANPHLEVINANIICGLSGLHLNLSFLLGMSNITDLRLYCNRNLDGSLKSLECLNNLQHLYLLGIKNLNNLPFESCNFGQSGKLQTLGLGDCWNVPNTFVNEFLKNMTSLKKLRIENSFNVINILERVSQLRNIECLELVDITTGLGFEQSLKLCTNVKKLIIVPKPERLKMAEYHTRIIVGVITLKNTLKKFTWGFMPRYLEYTYKISEQKNCVPIIPFATCDSINSVQELRQWLEPTSFISLNDLQKMISSEMTYSTVKVNCKEYTGSVFLLEA